MQKHGRIRRTDFHVVFVLQRHKERSYIIMRRATDGFGLDITTTSPEVVQVLGHFTQQVISFDTHH